MEIMLTIWAPDRSHRHVVVYDVWSREDHLDIPTSSTCDQCGITIEWRAMDESEDSGVVH